MIVITSETDAEVESVTVIVSVYVPTATAVVKARTMVPFWRFVVVSETPLIVTGSAEAVLVPVPLATFIVRLAAFE
jgi:hypothetical protein